MPASLLTLFMPPKEHFGDFGLLCGFTASDAMLERLRRSFSGDVARPVLAAFTHPTTAPDAQGHVPGVARIPIDPSPERGFRLLHAKVALLGFRRTDPAGYCLRLAVSTGNWTEDPLKNSIDLFWSVDLDPSKPTPQACADLRAAWDMFEWLRGRGDCSLIEQQFDGVVPDARLREKILGLDAMSLSPRFVDNRRDGLATQFVERIPQNQKFNRLIIGSGYYEGGSPKEFVFERLRDTLTEQGILAEGANPDLLLNPASCQGIAHAAERLATDGWKLRSPTDPSVGNAKPDRKLHAKFALLANGRGKEACEGYLYLGSGNMTGPGFERSAGDSGNLEAGIMMALPKGLTWRANGPKSIYKRLPLARESAKAIPTLHSGQDYERPQEPDGLPPVTYLIWRAGRIEAPDQGGEVAIIGPDGQYQETPCDWAVGPPIAVKLAESGILVPVIADGALVEPLPIALRVEDVLARIGNFPAPPEPDDEEDEEDPGEMHGADAIWEPRRKEAAAYTLRRMMGLLAATAEAQARTDPRDWQRWCRELRQMLKALSENEAEMIDFFRAAAVNPLPALLDTRMMPKGLDARERERLKQNLNDVARNWGLEGYPSLWKGG